MDRVGIADFLRRRRRALQPKDVGLRRRRALQPKDVGLRRRRALQPKDVGLPLGQRRRTGGLRREEVAALANISSDFYARLEQRRGARPSVRTVNAITHALRLTPDERDHLFALAGHQAPPRTTWSAALGAGLVRLLEHLDVPAQIVSELGVTLRQNALAQAISGVQTGRKGLERSMIYRWFIGSEERARVPTEDQDFHSRRYVAHLRAVHGRAAADGEARTLVDELYRRSRAFARLWDQYEVALMTNAPKRFCHPAVGQISLESEVLSLQNRTEVLLLFTAARDSEDAERLAFLSAFVRKNSPR